MVARIVASDMVLYGIVTQMAGTQVVWTAPACDQPPESQSRHAPLVPMAHGPEPECSVCLPDGHGSDGEGQACKSVAPPH